MSNRGTRPASLVDVLRTRAAREPDDRAYTFLRDGESESAVWTWAALDQRSRAIAAQLQTCVPPGARALLLYPSSLDFIAAFFGCLYAGVIAVPAPVPPVGRSTRGLERLRSIARDAAPAAVLTTREVLARWPDGRVADGFTSSTERRPASGPTWIVTDEIGDQAASAWKPVRIDTTALAFLQYTSGSTAEPKGVMVSHGNLLHNLSYASELAGGDGPGTSVSWLPLTHDMGLIEGVLLPVFSGCAAYLMSPMAFLQRPVRWLEAISRYRAARSGAPNFAYDLAVRKTTVEQRSQLDLATWRNAYNGSEPVRTSTMAAFAAAFGDAGFRASAFRPCYGLAEATLVVSSGRWSGEEDGPASCGAPSGDVRATIVHPETARACLPGEEGEVWVSGPSVAQGYWNRPDETTRAFGAYTTAGDGPFLRTGDLGRMTRGELVVTGRIKDLLIVRGLKHFPQDLEHTAEEQHAAIRRGSVAALAVPGDASGDRIVLLAEVDHRQLDGPDAGHLLIAALRQATADVHGVQLHGAALVPAGSLPKTTSGKLQRFACRDAWLAATLPILARWEPV